MQLRGGKAQRLREGDNGSGAQFTKMPTNETSGGNSRRMLRAANGEIERGLSIKVQADGVGAKFRGETASSGVVTPQIFTRTIEVVYWKRGRASQRIALELTWWMREASLSLHSG